MTKTEGDVRLYLNRVIQFSSADEHRYHESLVHIPLAIHANPERVLILGGGENLASREVLKHKSVQHIDVVDIDITDDAFFIDDKQCPFRNAVTA